MQKSMGQKYHDKKVIIIVFQILLSFMLLIINHLSKQALSASKLIENLDKNNEKEFSKLLENNLKQLLLKPDGIYTSNLLNCLHYKKLPARFISLLPINSFSNIEVKYKFKDPNFLKTITNKNISKQNVESIDFEELILFVKDVNHSNIILSKVIAKFYNLRINKTKALNEKIEFISIDNISLQVIITPQNLIHYIAKFYGNEISNLKFDISTDQITVAGYIRQKFIPVKFRCIGKPKILDQSIISFECQNINIMGLSMPKLKDLLHKEVNPIFDANKFIPKPTIEKIEHLENTIICYAKL